MIWTRGGRTAWYHGEGGACGTAGAGHWANFVGRAFAGRKGGTGKGDAAGFVRATGRSETEKREGKYLVIGNISSCFLIQFISYMRFKV